MNERYQESFVLFFQVLFLSKMMSNQTMRGKKNLDAGLPAHSVARGGHKGHQCIVGEGGWDLSGKTFPTETATEGLLAALTTVYPHAVPLTQMCEDAMLKLQQPSCDHEEKAEKLTKMVPRGLILFPTSGVTDHYICTH